MKKDDIQTFSYRISQANRTQLVVITLDMAVQYIKDAKEDQDINSYRQNLRNAKRVIDLLVSSLDMSYDISSQLFDVYMVVERYIISAGSRRPEQEGSTAGYMKLLESCERMLTMLRKSFYEVSKLDDSTPLMQNTQQVYAGLTYSNGGGASEMLDASANRGYKA
ncbi:MAG: flagellar protein FliS [Clostridia bacterium]|nr:flagellar protein FliS [Clostridia bacterium]